MFIAYVWQFGFITQRNDLLQVNISFLCHLMCTVVVNNRFSVFYFDFFFQLLHDDFLSGFLLDFCSIFFNQSKTGIFPCHSAQIYFSTIDWFLWILHCNKFNFQRQIFAELITIYVFLSSFFFRCLKLKIRYFFMHEIEFFFK